MTRKTYCDDWTCPASASCAHHFGRSAAYAGMKPAKTGHGDGTPYDRHASEDRQSCAAYRFDRPKAWLMPQAGQVNVFVRTMVLLFVLLSQQPCPPISECSGPPETRHPRCAACYDDV